MRWVFGRIPFDHQARWTFGTEVQALLDRRQLQGRAQVPQKVGGVECLQMEVFASGLQAGQAQKVFEEARQRRDVGLEQGEGLGSQAVRQAVLGQDRGGRRHQPHIAPQIVGGLAPDLRPLPVHVAELRDGVLKVLVDRFGFSLLQAGELFHAVRNPFAGELQPEPAPEMQHLGEQPVAPGLGVLVELVHDADLEMPHSRTSSRREYPSSHRCAPCS